MFRVRLLSSRQLREQKGPDAVLFHHFDSSITMMNADLCLCPKQLSLRFVYYFTCIFPCSSILYNLCASCMIFTFINLYYVESF